MYTFLSFVIRLSQLFYTIFKSFNSGYVLKKIIFVLGAYYWLMDSYFDLSFPYARSAWGPGVLGEHESVLWVVTTRVSTRAPDVVRRRAGISANVPVFAYAGDGPLCAPPLDWARLG